MRSIATRLLALTVALTALGAPARPVAAVTLVMDPERNSTAAIGWGWQTAKTATSINAWINLTGQRPIDIEVDTPTAATPTFSVAYAANSGSFARTWWWYTALTSTQLATNLTTNNARLIDLEPYINGAGALRYAAIMVANTGAAAKTWWYFTGQTAASIGTQATSLGARPIDIDRYVSSGTTRYSVVFIKNTGVDARGWAHLYAQSLTTINNYAATNNMRLLQLERVPGATTYDAVLQGRTGTDANIYTISGQSVTGVNNTASQQGARVFKIEPYKSGTSTFYAALLLDVTDAETRRIKNLVASRMSGSWGFYVKKVGGSDVVALQPDRVFEPASMLKILHAVRALREDQGSATITPTTKITWYADPDNPARYPTDMGYAVSGGVGDKDTCAYDADDGTLITSQSYSDNLGSVIIAQMLQNSDNRTTDALVRRYGFPSLNALADTAGMTSTNLNHRIGCQGAGSPQPWTNNDLTLRDAGRIYERVENLTLLDLTRRSLLYSYLLGGPISDTGSLATMIRSEGAALTFTEREQFIDQVVTRSKGGGYRICPSTGACNPPWMIDSTVGGIMWLPFKNSVGTVVPTAFVYGRFYNIPTTCSSASLDAGTCTAINNANAGMNTLSFEMFRQIVKQALATW